MRTLNLEFLTPQGLILAAILICFAPSAWTQPDRLSAPINPRRIQVLSGNRRPGLLPQSDQGAVDPSLEIDSITLMARPSARQQAELEQLLAEQQDPQSPNYHHWLRPSEFADRFGLSRGDLAKITAWLQAEGFRVGYVPPSRNFLMFRGTAAQVQHAFATELHYYVVNGERHFANASEPSVPADLAPLVTGIRGLDDFHWKPASHRVRVIPDFTGFNSAGTIVNYLAPDDFATIYDLGPLYRAGYDGSGQSIAIAGECHLAVADVEQFRSTYGLSANDPQLVLVPTSPDPGSTNMDACGEADLDVDWSGAVARNATVVYVYATNAFTAMEYIIAENLAPVLSLSFGGCEASTPVSELDEVRQLAQEANAEGMTWLSASGDTGAFACDPNFGPTPATQPVSVTNPAGVPEVTAVGGTQLIQGPYWNSSNSITGASARSYIPETAWNESIGQLAASGGGLSSYYAEPAWQAAVSANAMGMRAVPDVALNAAILNGYLGFIGGRQVIFAGTSASTPAFAGLVAVLNQYQVANGIQAQPGQGNINPKLYSLFQSTPQAFHDITAGTNIVNCTTAPACVNGSFGYSAGPGYDLVTGLGSVDASLLIPYWSNTVVATSTAVTANPAIVPPGSSTQITATVTAASGSRPPTGTVDFTYWGMVVAQVTLAGSGTSASVSMTLPASQVSEGPNTVLASYSGDLTFAPSSGSTIITLSVPNITSVNPGTAVAGSSFTLTVTGTGFVANSQILFAGPTIGQPLATTFISATQLSAVVPATLLPQAGMVAVTVRNTYESTTYDSQTAYFTVVPPVTSSTVTSSVPHLATGGGIVSAIYVINHSGSKASFAIRFYDDTGAPVAVPFNNGGGIPLPGAISVLSDTVQPQAMNYYQTTEPVSGQISGWGLVSSDPSITLQVLFRRLGSDGKYYEAAVPPGSGLNEIIIPFDDTVFASANEQIYTGLAIANLDSANSANVVCTAWDSSGNIIPGAVTVPTLNPLGHWAGYQFQSLVGLRGSIDCTSNTQISAIGIRALGANAISSLPVLPAVAAVTPGVISHLPHVAAGAGLVTGISVVNTGDQSANFSIAFYDDTGQPMSLQFNGSTTATTSLSGQLPPHGEAYYETPATQIVSVSGSGVITADSTVGFQALFRRLGGDGSYYEAAVPTSAGNYQIEIPFDDSTFLTGMEQIYTGLAIANIDPVNPATVSCTARSDIGAVIAGGITLPALPPLGHWADYQFPLLKGQQGSINCSSNAKIGSIGIRALGANAISSLPVTPLR